MRYLGRQDVHRLAGKTGADPRTIRRWLEDPMRVTTSIAYALEAARVELGIEYTKAPRLQKTG